MFHRFLCFCLLLLFKDSVFGNDEHESCSLFRGNHTVTVTKTDENGNKCHGIVPVAICGGLCQTSEKGTHFFPHRENENSACVPLATAPVNHKLTDCDEKALPSIRTITFNDTQQCGCKSMDNTVN